MHQLSNFNYYYKIYLIISCKFYLSAQVKLLAQELCNIFDNTAAICIGAQEIFLCVWKLEIRSVREYGFQHKTLGIKSKISKVALLILAGIIKALYCAQNAHHQAKGEKKHEFNGDVQEYHEITINLKPTQSPVWEFRFLQNL